MAKIILSFRPFKRGMIVGPFLDGRKIGLDRLLQRPGFLVVLHRAAKGRSRDHVSSQPNRTVIPRVRPDRARDDRFRQREAHSHGCQTGVHPRIVRAPEPSGSARHLCRRLPRPMRRPRRNFRRRRKTATGYGSIIASLARNSASSWHVAMGNVHPASRPCLSTSMAESKSPRSTHAMASEQICSCPGFSSCQLARLDRRVSSCPAAENRRFGISRVGHPASISLARIVCRGGERNSFRLRAGKKVLDECHGHGTRRIVRDRRNPRRILRVCSALRMGLFRLFFWI